MPNRHGSTDDYRYGFQGQEKDDEIKGEGNSLNYKYRMHDPRVGRFFAVDPLVHDYPWYSPYQFSGNTPIMSIELEGLEPVVENGILVGYTVQKGFGPSQVSLDINDPATQKKYGYTLQKSVTWKKVVMDNVKYYAKKGDWKESNMLDINNSVYTKLNSEVGDHLNIIIERPKNAKPISKNAAHTRLEEGGGVAFYGEGGSNELGGVDDSKRASSTSEGFGMPKSNKVVKALEKINLMTKPDEQVRREMRGNEMSSISGKYLNSKTYTMDTILRRNWKTEWGTFSVEVKGSRALDSATNERLGYFKREGLNVESTQTDTLNKHDVNVIHRQINDFGGQDQDEN